MDAVVQLSSGSHAKVKDLYFSTKVRDAFSKAVIKQTSEEKALIKDLYSKAKSSDLSDSAMVSQTYIFGGVPYIGEYEVTPASYEQVLHTSGKTMKQDVEVHEVPYYETSNESGGFTVSILS